MADPYLDLGGTIRARAPAETLARIQPLFERVGLTRIADVTGLDCVGIPVSVAVRPLARTLSTSQGKGATRELARISAAMESIELWHAENPAPPSVISASYEALRGAGETVLDPCSLCAGVFPELKDLRATACDWHRGHDLVTDRPVLVPVYASRLAFDYNAVEGLVLNRSSNGLASGNTLAEASCHALYEVIERDAYARWLSLGEERQLATEVDPGSVGGPCAQLLDRFAAAALRVRIWEQTSAVGVPTFYCVIRGDADLRGLSTYGGGGTHWDTDIALSRALTEAAQSRLTAITGSREDFLPVLYDMCRITSGEVLALADPRGLRPYAQCARPAYDASLEENRDAMVERLVAAGFGQVVIVDLTKPDLGLPVVFAHVPGAWLHLE